MEQRHSSEIHRALRIEAAWPLPWLQGPLGAWLKPYLRPCGFRVHSPKKARLRGVSPFTRCKSLAAKTQSDEG